MKQTNGKFFLSSVSFFFASTLKFAFTKMVEIAETSADFRANRSFNEYYYLQHCKLLFFLIELPTFDWTPIHVQISYDTDKKKRREKKKKKKMVGIVLTNRKIHSKHISWLMVQVVEGIHRFY